jgi:CRISPR-associated protein Cmr6
MARGRVKRWDVGKGTGQIVDNDDQAEVFFGDRSFRGLAPGEIHVGLELEYDRGQNERGPVARNVRRAVAGAAPSTPAGPAPSRRFGDPGGSRLQAHRGDGIPTPPQEVPVPRSLQRLLEPGQMPLHQAHPGLRLDKFLRPCADQKQQREVLGGVAKLPGDGSLLGELRLRRDDVLRGLKAHTWSQATSGRLTLHLARASALENAGLCLHPLYGFTYLPGTGLKGLARAYAETVWIASLPIAEQASGWQRVESVFGWAPGSDLIEKGQPKPWKPGDAQSLSHKESQAASR